ncbi:DNA-directed RNA polymerase III subunit RPC4-like [Dendronephthya gigantea]|uniref:DNA-directed RNA polymerase III subunit RPC4-like n=1 Tax=Dendronephthya gigantea TaxID=151771 RepID=UPI00106C7064|nr:DNA-directed RNA polymerase III subunit RPC4-like [Dendronephthya gigantea]
MAEKTPDAKKQPRAGLAVKRGRGRLQSLRSPRDLTLGGSTKRTYAPTIPVRRIKEEPKDTPSEQKPNHGGGQTRQRGRGRDRGRGRGRGQPNIIQSKSIFSEGLVPKTASVPSRAPSYREGGGFAESTKSERPKAEKNFEVEDPNKILQMIDSDGEMDIDEAQLACGILPMHIPLAYHDRFVEEVVNDEDISSVKVEPMETDEKKPFVRPSNKGSKKKTKEDQPMTCERLLTGNDKKKKDQMLFFQFPDSLPTKVLENEEEGSKEKNKSLKLQDISEGYIGKIQVLKSGKTRLILGGVALDVSMGTPCNFLQDIVSIHPEEESRSMMTLCHVKQRLVCTPDFEELLKQNSDVT